MSAIAGLWRFDGRPDAAAVDCGRMLDAQRMYGPHDARTWDGGALAMGRRLFRTVPEDVHDRQPLHSRDGRLTLVADIRLDNRDELARLLELTHTDTSTLCDAAVLLACLERWGARSLDRLAGDFAFALFDASSQTLTLARDYSGQRPLHYHSGRGFFAFASMPKGLHALHEIPRAPDEDAITELVALIPENSPRSFFAGIERVRPAHVVTITRKGVSSRCYWEPPRPARASAHDTVEGLRHHLDQATKAQLRGINGSIGVHLSGGLDSSAVTATAARLLAPAGGKVVAFTAVPREEFPADGDTRLIDEGPLAAETAAQYANVEHVLIRSGHVSPVAGLDRMFFLYDRPIMNPANWVWMAAIHDAARERKLGVMLTGQLGNLTLSYNGKDLLPELLRAGRLLKFRQVASSRIAQSGLTWRSAITESVNPYLPAAFWRWATKRFGTLRRDVVDRTALRAERAAALDLAAIARDREFDFTYRRWSDSFALRRQAIIRRDPGNYNKGYLAGWSIDRRDPTADKRLAEYCLAVPTEEYLADGVPRALARKTLADRLPSAVLTERRSGFQAADWHEGLAAARPEIADELARLSECAPAARTLDIERMQRLMENWPVSGWEQRETIQQYRMALLRGLAAGHFLRKASGANR